MARRTPSECVRRAATALAVLAALPLVAATAVVADTLTAAPAAAAPLQTLVNPTFDGTAGWFESTTRGTLTSVPGRRGTGARLAHTAPSRYTVILQRHPEHGVAHRRWRQLYRHGLGARRPGHPGEHPAAGVGHHQTR